MDTGRKLLCSSACKRMILYPTSATSEHARNNRPTREADGSILLDRAALLQLWVGLFTEGTETMDGINWWVAFPLDITGGTSTSVQ